MRTSITLLFVLSTVAMTGCINTVARHRTAQTAELAASFGAPASIVRTMEGGGRLSLDEIGALAQTGFPAEETVGYLRSGNAVYALKTAQIDELRAAGVSDLVIDYMLGTPLRGNAGLFSQRPSQWPGFRGGPVPRVHTRGVH